MEDLDLTEQAALLSRGEVTPRELIEASIARIDKFEPQLSAITTRQFEQALIAADNLPKGTLLGGAPFLHKDLLDVPGFTRSDGAHRIYNDQFGVWVEF